MFIFFTKHKNKQIQHICLTCKKTNSFNLHLATNAWFIAWKTHALIPLQANQVSNHKHIFQEVLCTNKKACLELNLEQWLSTVKPHISLRTFF